MGLVQGRFDYLGFIIANRFINVIKIHEGLENLKPSANRHFLFIDSETEVGNSCQSCDPGSEIPQFTIAIKQINMD